MMLRMLSLSAVVLALLATSTLAAGLEAGDKAPDFKATGIDGKEYTLANAKDSKVTVVCFTCNECPVAVAYEDRFIEFDKQYKDKGVKLIAINVNANEDLEAMKQRAEEKGFTYPYAYDETGDACRAYGATKTPHLFIFNAAGKLVYQGAFDDSMVNPTKSYAVDAVEATLQGKTPEVTFTKAVGCGINPRS